MESLPFLYPLITWAIIVIGLLIINYVLFFIFRTVFYPVFKKSSYQFKYLYRPWNIFIWILILAITCQSLSDYFDFQYLNIYIRNVRNIGLVFSVAWFTVRLWNVYEGYLITRSKEISSWSSDMIYPLRKAIHGVIWFVAFLTSLEIFHVGLGSLLTLGGLGGLAVSLAARDPLANFFGGLTVYCTRSFKVGDQVIVKDKGVEGRVEHIGWYMTRLITEEGEEATVPNSTFSTSVTINKNKRS